MSTKNCVIYKRSYFLGDKRVGPVEVYNGNHEFIGVYSESEQKLILGREKDGCFIPNTKENSQPYQLLGSRQLYEARSNGKVWYFGYGQDGEEKIAMGFNITWEYLAGVYGKHRILPRHVANQSQLQGMRTLSNGREHI